VDLGEAQGRPECLGDPAGPAGIDGVAVAVASGDTDRAAGCRSFTLRKWTASCSEQLGALKTSADPGSCRARGTVPVTRLVTFQRR
jgi:hypothetical protein